MLHVASGSSLDVVALRLPANQLGTAVGEGASHVRGDLAFLRGHQVVATAAGIILDSYKYIWSILNLYKTTY